MPETPARIPRRSTEKTMDGGPGDLMQLLRQDHAHLKQLFQRFEAADGRSRFRIGSEICAELKLHTAIEEKIIYPAFRRAVNAPDLFAEADEEHHVAKLLVKELERMERSDEHYVAKMKVLAENVRHHIEEEEGRMLPRAEPADIDFSGIVRRARLMKERAQLRAA